MNSQAQQILTKYANQAPVPIIDIAKSLGIKAYDTNDLQDDESGVIIKENGQYIIYLNQKHSARRKRFTIAHEIAHFLLHKSYLDEKEELIQRNKQPLARQGMARGSLKNLTPKELQLEKEANHFAASLLMPEEIFTKIWRQSSSIEEVADYFLVSTHAANMRGQTLLKEFFY